MSQLSHAFSSAARILPKRMEEIADKFLLILYEAEGAKFDRQEGGHRESLTQTVMIGVGGPGPFHSMAHLEVNEADDGASKWLDATFNCDEAQKKVKCESICNAFCNAFCNACPLHLHCISFRLALVWLRGVSPAVMTR